ncbi:MAG: NOL1/NOP2/sun family putative RNA methylase [Ruminococcaceae bacterium]|nr:NOL1/NOP2/sun family putative RNA methylase [Oscillospiraceae bacterium]
MITLPSEYKKRMQALLGQEFAKYEASLNQNPIRAFRVNYEKISLEDFQKLNIFGNEKIPFVENGFYTDFEKIGNHPYHHAGLIYVQEPAAMAPCECIAIKPDWKILDMCAAPGGKSSQLRNKLSASGVLVSNEIIPSRCKILTGNIERLGFKNTVTTCCDSKRLAKAFPKTFDMIMVDAPCSGEGMFRKEPVAVSEWSEENVLKCAQRQREILENATKCLKDGGYIVYSTCTFSLEENEMVVDEFLSSHPDFEISPVNAAICENTDDGILFEDCKCKDLHLARRFYPHKHKGEGQFMAVLHNKCAAAEHFLPPHKLKQPEKAVFEFLDDILTDYSKDNVMLYNNNPVYFTPNFNVPEGIAFSCGVTIGELRKNYIQPHHQFFMALGDKFKRKIELEADSKEIKQYLHGEEIKTDLENGWAVVTVGGSALGGAKIVSGVAKNHYPKGLRLVNI